MDWYNQARPHSAYHQVFRRNCKSKASNNSELSWVDNPASWLFSIETAENLYSFPEISLENVIDPDTARKTVSDWTRDAPMK
ncbi:MAG: hypothetical protein ABS69_08910 [Nitrosomonadales bacterium SCN 54-20]|nr:MAG: hypothetical protein ABS69_08910 [Nitrosomonadales bacterium SCN 54-20]